MVQLVGVGLSCEPGSRISSGAVVRRRAANGPPEAPPDAAVGDPSRSLMVAARRGFAVGGACSGCGQAAQQLALLGHDALAQRQLLGGRPLDGRLSRADVGRATRARRRSPCLGRRASPLSPWSVDRQVGLAAARRWRRRPIMWPSSSSTDALPRQSRMPAAGAPAPALATAGPRPR